ncbi:tagaturonate epimerase family protein [Balneolales bacterium ANBcel1]|nr:tagaturonate epimerase family protein [Balneolales bacterium ANBcel1]
MTISEFSNRRDLFNRLEKAAKGKANKPLTVILPDGQGEWEVYPKSIRKSARGGLFVAGNYNRRNALFIVGDAGLKVMERYAGRKIARIPDAIIKKCRLTRNIMRQLREDFPHCAPTGRQNGNLSIAFGDVLGMAGKAQMLAFSGTADLIFSRQCVHQLSRLELDPEDALDAVTWSVFQEGYDGGYAAEACQVTTPEDLEKMLDAGFTRFSVEPANPCLFSLREESKRNLLERMFQLPWIELRDKFELMFNRYINRRIDLPEPEKAAWPGDETERDPLVIIPSEKEVLAAMGIYAETICQVTAMEQVLVRRKCRSKVTLEVSFSRAGGNLTPFEHFFVINELFRRDVHPDYFAPGEITLEHQLVAWLNKGYGLTGEAGQVLDTIHEEFPLTMHGIYPDISYRTALHCIVQKKPDLFRKIWETSRNRFQDVGGESLTSLKIHHIPSVKDYSDHNLAEILETPNTDDFLKVSLLVVMTDRDETGNRYLRQKLMAFLQAHEMLYTEALLETYRLWTGEGREEE